MTKSQRCVFVCWMKRRTNHGDVPGADEMNVFHQVLPGQKTPEVNVKLLPQNQSLLVTGLQTDGDINITSQCVSGHTVLNITVITLQCFRSYCLKHHRHNLTVCFSSYCLKHHRHNLTVCFSSYCLKDHRHNITVRFRSYCLKHHRLNLTVCFRSYCLKHHRHNVTVCFSSCCLLRQEKVSVSLALK